MILRKPYKFIWSNDDPHLLYHLDNDPKEPINLAYDPQHSSTANLFVDEIRQTWNCSLLTSQVVQSQRRVTRFSTHKPMVTNPAGIMAGDTGERGLWYRGETGYNDWAFPGDITPEQT